jgi:hypothetical protein
MSDMLEQAIIDAEALREAATKNAETLILEKYSSQIKGAVESLLEQDDLSADLGMGEDMAPVDMAAPDGSEPPTEVSSVMEHIPLATTSRSDEQIEIPLDELLKEITELSETIRFNGDFIQDESLYEHNLKEDMDEELYEDMDEELYEDMDEDLDEDLDLFEDFELEEDADTLEEQLTVDLAAENKSGWAGTPAGVIELAEEEVLALEQDSKIREKNDAIRTAVKDLKAVSEATKKENTVIKTALNKSTKFITKLRDAVTILEEKLDKANVANAKLLYQNKALESDSLNERQKQKLVEAVSNAETIEEAKVIFETLQNTVGSTSHKTQPNSLSEAIQKSSSVILSARKQNSGGQEANPTLNRWKFLAGIDKPINS